MSSTTEPAPACGGEQSWGCEEISAAEAVGCLRGAARPEDLELLSLVDPGELPDELARLEFVAHLDRVVAYARSLQAAALVSVAGPVPSGSYLGEVHVEHEVALARGTSRYAAGRAIETARALATTFAGFAAALRAGEVSEAHCSVLVDRTRSVLDEQVLAAVEARVLSRAKVLAPGAFGRAVELAVADLDPDAEGRHRRARQERGVSTRPLADGLGYLGLVHEWATVAAIAATVDADAAVLRAQRGGAAAVAAGDQDAGADACRADALAARVLGTVGEDGQVVHDPAAVPVTLELVIDLDTLRGEADRAAVLAGQPVPAGVARDWAQCATTWRRCVTDPVDGHLLDYGTTTYLPARLRRFVMARDGSCRAPMCGVASPRRLQLDHAVEYPAGPSTAGNTGALCGTCHQLKTDRHAHLTDSRPDGSATWTTTWGQSVRIPARPYLHDPRDPVPPGRGPATDEPPRHDRPGVPLPPDDRGCDPPPF